MSAQPSIHPHVRSAVGDIFTGALALAWGVLFGVVGLTDYRIYFPALLAFFLAAGYRRGAKPGPSWPLRAVWITLPLLVIDAFALLSWREAGLVGVLLVLVEPLLRWAAAAFGLWTAGRRPRLSGRVAGARLLLAAVAAFTVGWLTLPALMSVRMTSVEDRPAPPLSFVALDGAVVDSSAWAGKVVVVDFWTTWCPPCLEGLPELARLAEGYRDRDDVVFWALNPLTGGDTEENARAFAAEQAYRLPFALDFGQQAAQALGMSGLPHLFLIDRQGRVRFEHRGFNQAEDYVGVLSAKIDALLAEDTTANSAFPTSPE